MSHNATIEGLQTLQADATVFYQRLRAFHWTVKGPHFFGLHEAFENLYNQWNAHLDDLAERIVQLGGIPLLTLADILKTGSIKESTQVAPATEMVRQVVRDLSDLLKSFAKTREVAAQADDRTTENLLDAIVDETRKTLWMYESLSQE